MSGTRLVLCCLLMVGCERSILVGRTTGDAQSMDASDAMTDASDATTDAPLDVPDAMEEGGIDCNQGFTATHIAVGDDHACAIHLGQVFCWGDGQTGQLGTGETTSSGIPVPILATGTFDGLTAMTFGTCAHRMDDGMLLCFGDNFGGGLANGGMQNDPDPNETLTGAAEFAGGQSYMLTRDASGTMTVWGDNEYGKLGLGSALAGMAIRTETPIAGSAFFHLAGGAHHACVTDAAGHAYCAGDNILHQLGMPGGERNVFTAVPSSPVFTELDAGLYVTCGITSANDLYCWGRNEDPVVVPAALSGLESPTRVGTASDWEQVSVGFDTICGLRNGGHLFCWGHGDHSALGQPGDDTDKDVPTAITPTKTFSAVSVGRDFACAIRVDDDTVVCWGDNEDLQLGRGTSTSRALGLVCKP